ncbi:MAG: precorrin-6B C5,15-methyltransferase / cobalt-precorrin-6B C5,C15-methyltransferase [Mycobacterium sp.]|nr:precorrin-6B C5,15-methyltransferase / cobalt-precorrin-6B C5,C15-methyltransferase [Mycobacterium sp.]
MITVVGIGADGFAGLSDEARAELRKARTIYGSRRQLDLLDDSVGGQRHEWSRPLIDALRALPDDVHVLASGDPLLHGVGGTLVRLFGPARVRVLPHVSSVTLACARLGWSVQEVEVISLVTAQAHTAVRRGGRAVVLSRDHSTPGALARLLTETGRGASRLCVLEQLGGPGERRRDETAAQWAAAPPTGVDDLNVVAVEYLPDERVVALPDDAFDHDGQLTKQSIRAVTLAALAPRPGKLLWDVGAGAGSVAVVWALAARGCSAVAFERDERRRARIAHNMVTFGVAIEVRGAAPDAFDGAADPAVVFVGGGLTQPGLLEACVDRLPVNGRLVANAVTAESEAILAQWYSSMGGELRRFQHYAGEPLGKLTGWRPAMPVTQWAVTKR